MTMFAKAAPMNRAPSIGQIALYVALALAAVWFLAPFWVMFVTSLKTPQEIAEGNIFAWPRDPSFAAWEAAWGSACAGLECSGLQEGFANSLLILAPSVAASVFLGAWTAYGLCFWTPVGRRLMLAILFFAAFAPAQMFTYPLVAIFSALRIYNTLPCIILVHTVFGLPITTFLFASYYQSIPQTLVRAAELDGAGYWRIFRSIVLPLSLPAYAIVAIFQTNGVWNDFFFGLVFAGPDHMPMTVQLNNIVNTTTGDRRYDIDMAATILTSAVPLIVSVASGKWFVRALTGGALKG